MESFDELDLDAELVEALAAAGIETPSALQAQVFPVIRRGGSLLLGAGPGSGATLACALGVLARLEPDRETPAPRALFLAFSRLQTEGIALSLARLAAATGHRVAALNLPWALPERADLLVATPTELREEVEAARIKLDGAEAVVVLGLGEIRAGGATAALEAVLKAVPEGAQRIFTALPFGREDRDFAEAHARRAVLLPTDAAREVRETVPKRGELLYRVTREEKDLEVPEVVASLLEDDHDHVLLYFRSVDRAADVGDELGLRGYATGRPGETGAPVWLATDPLEARSQSVAVGESVRVATVSVDVPANPDDVDRRHSSGTLALSLAQPRELEHLRWVARRAGYALKAAPGATPAGIGLDVEAYLDRVRRALQEEDLAPHILLLEPLFREHSHAEIAGALSLLLRSRPRAGARPTATEEARPAGAAKAPPAWVKVFISIGERDGVGPGDLLGAITGEAGIAGSQVGRIEIRDTFSKVDVEQGVADRVIRSLNGTTLRGRSVRADYDRGDRARARGGERDRRRGPGGGGGPRRPGPDRGR